MIDAIMIGKMPDEWTPYEWTPYEPRRALRSAGSAQLCVPRQNLERCGRRSFSCAGPVFRPGAQDGYSCEEGQKV